MSDHVFVVSEWLPKENCEEELWNFFKELMAFTKKTKVGALELMPRDKFLTQVLQGHPSIRLFFFKSTSIERLLMLTVMQTTYRVLLRDILRMKKLQSLKIGVVGFLVKMGMNRQNKQFNDQAFGIADNFLSKNLQVVKRPIPVVLDC